MQRKKVLIITYYWPPSGGSGVQRWLKFAKYLPIFGWDPIILTPSNPHFVIHDPSLKVDEKTITYKVPIWEPYHIANQFMRCFKTKKIAYNTTINQSSSTITQIATWIRANLFIPDPKICWIIPAYRKAIKIIQEQNIEVLISTGPPHSMHLVGLMIKKKIKIPWIADFRDPWSTWDTLQQLPTTSYSMRLHKYLEKKVLKKADSIITVSNSWQASLNQLAKKKKTTVITNGFDEMDFQHYTSIVHPKKFRISYIGLINEFRNISLLWEVLQTLCEKEPNFHQKLEINLVGQIPTSFLQSIQQFSMLKNCIVYKGYLPHDQIIHEYAHSALLLLIQNQSSSIHGHIPGKFFEYLASEKPILLLGDTTSDLAQWITNMQCGIVCNFVDKNTIKLGIIQLFQQFQKKIKSPLIDKKKFTHKNLTKKLVLQLNQIHSISEGSS